MEHIDRSCRDFTEAVAGKDPVPGGGSVSALAGALGTALGHMVVSLTKGKKKYADNEEIIAQAMEEAESLRRELLDLVRKDMEAFEPLSRLYSMKAETEEEKERKSLLMEKALEDACAVPMEIMEKCGRAIELAGIFAEKGSRLAVSDAGAGAVICSGALRAASLNVYINTKTMKDREKAERLNRRCDDCIEKYSAMADRVFGYTVDILKKTQTA